jgi:hypothetical protein
MVVRVIGLLVVVGVGAWKDERDRLVWCVLSEGRPEESRKQLRILHFVQDDNVSLIGVIDFSCIEGCRSLRVPRTSPRL